MTLASFNNCRLTYESLIQFENEDVLTNGKTPKVLEIVVYLHSESQRLFANVSLIYLFKQQLQVHDVHLSRDTFVFYAMGSGASRGTKRF